MSDVLDVWLDGRYAGNLMRGEQDRVEYLYDEQYRMSPSSTPLSASMPKDAAGHGPDVVMSWLSNLLPDAEEVRRAAGRRSSTNVAPTRSRSSPI